MTSSNKFNKSILTLVMSLVKLKSLNHLFNIFEGGTQMEFRQLITFKSIIEHGGFKEAADQLDYAQSTITTHIKNLEEELEHELFNRLGNHVTLTHYGEKLLPYVKQLLQIYYQIEDLDDAPKGRLTIGISESLMICRIPEILEMYKKNYPKVQISLKSVAPNDIKAHLQKGVIDLALILENENWQNKLFYIEKLNTERMILAYSNSKQNLNTALYSDQFCSYQPMLKEYFKINYWDVQDSFEFQSIEAIKQCVEHGLGISIFPYFSIKKELERKQFTGEAVDVNNKGIATFLVYHQSKTLSSSEIAMIETIKACAQRWY